jgi:hypothetical protein
VFAGQDVNAAMPVVDAVDHPVVAAPGAVQPVEPELELLADPVGAGGRLKIGQPPPADVLPQPCQGLPGHGRSP